MSCRENALFELLSTTARLEGDLPLVRVKGVSTREKVGSSRSVNFDRGYKFPCRTSCRTILCRSGTRSSRPARRRPGGLSHLDSASPQTLIPEFLPRAPSAPCQFLGPDFSRREPPRSPPVPESTGECEGRRSIPDGMSQPVCCPSAPAPDPCLRSQSLPHRRLRVQSSERG